VTGRRIPVSIDPAEYAWLKEASEVTGVPIARLVHKALSNFRQREGATLVRLLGDLRDDVAKHVPNTDPGPTAEERTPAVSRAQEKR
jgi:hypothetical protein